MSSWDQFADIVATLAVAAFTSMSSVFGTGDPGGVLAPSAVTGQDQLGSVVRWAQQEDQPPIEQVGEETGDDVETLDEAGAPVEADGTTEDVELLDQGHPAETQDDVELLDQGPSVAPVADSAAPATVATEPVSSVVAPVTESGPVVPEDFGTGSVHVATGPAGFPAGLEDCHVGAVTGRAYVGIDCGDGGSSFVGHAPSFEEFPFVVDEGFPFNGESVFADLGMGQPEDNVATLFAAARGTTRDDSSAAPEIRTSGASSVTFEQRARGRESRADSESGHKKRGKHARRDGASHVKSGQSTNVVDKSSAESKQQVKRGGKKEDRANSSAERGKKGKSSKSAKNRHARKDAQSRSAE